MGLKIFKAIWFLSMIAVLANVLYIYAGLPETVLIEDAGPNSLSIGKETFFYIITPMVAFINAMVYLVSSVFRKDLDFRAWFHGLIVTLNIFFIIALSFIGLYNSGERYEYRSIDFVIYGSIALIVIWAMGWPVYSLFRKLKHKELV
jgi:cytochrome c biogenesis factor